jgi:transcriptional regulator with GAF, ATPase, and Fis domain
MLTREGQTTTINSPLERSPGERLVLLVVGDGVSFTQPLPSSGQLTIGRADDADLRLSEAWVSRRHAILHLGPELRVEDLGSANGTRVRGQAVASGSTVVVAPGDVIELGSTLLVIQRRATAEVASGASPLPASPSAPVAARPTASSFEPFVVIQDDRMKDLVAQIELVARGPINVLLLGETGVGKELMASLVHRKSPRLAKPFVSINCAALPEALLESELFGHERGAFTGAVHAKPGLLETADGGTVFLDEIGTLPLSLQAKLLRVIEERQVRRVGGLKPRRLDVRFVSATNRDLQIDVAAERFRADLFFRLAGITVQIPPLRERKSEVPQLAATFLAEICAQTGRIPAPILTSGALELLQLHQWPGNVRELRNVIERAALLCTSDHILPEHLSIGPVPRPAGPIREATSEFLPGDTGKTGLREDLASLERRRILEALDRCGGNQSRAARMLGISRNTLIARLKQYGVGGRRERVH